MAAYHVSTGAMTPGDFVMIQAYFMQLSGPLFNMGTLFREVAQSQVDVEDLFYMLKQKPLVSEKPDAVDFQYKKGEISFNNLTFGHPTEDPKDMQLLFKDFNLKIEPGTTNAIVGSSGFGKTTMLYLMFRIYDSLEGSVTIDGQDLRDLKTESFRKYISVIP